jgi:MFS family permease
VNAPSAPGERKPSPTLSYLRSKAAVISAGGTWTGELSRAAQRRLRWFWFDGAFAAGVDSIVTTYLMLYAVALGASSTQVGLMSSVSGLAGAAALLPGAMLVEWIGRRKEVCLWGGGGVGRIALLLFACMPLFLHGQPAVFLAILLVGLRDFSGSLSFPAWNSLAADIVPPHQRGRYFSSRTIASILTGTVSVFMAGLVINARSGPAGFQWALVIAFLFGAVSTFCFSRIDDSSSRLPRPETAAQGAEPPAGRSMLGSILSNRVFLRLCLFSAVWNFSLNAAAPFFNIYLVQGLKATGLQVGIVATATSLASLPALRRFGPLSDRWGPRRIILITSLLIPILPLAWMVIPSPWYVFAINLASGVLWSGFNLCILNFIFQITPVDERARFTAVHQVIVAVALAVGSAVGGGVVSAFGYKAVFLISAVGRFTAAVIFAKYVK